MDVKLPDREYWNSSELQYMCRLGSGKFLSLLSELGINRIKRGRGIVVSSEDVHKVLEHLHSDSVKAEKPTEKMISGEENRSRFKSPFI